MQDQKTRKLPDPTSEQVREAHEIIRRALGGQDIRVWADSEGRICWAPVERGQVRRA